MGKVKNLVDGTKLAKEIVSESLASQKLEQLVDTLGGKNKLRAWKKKAGLPETKI